MNVGSFNRVNNKVASSRYGKPILLDEVMRISGVGELENQVTVCLGPICDIDSGEFGAQVRFVAAKDAKMPYFLKP